MSIPPSQVHRGTYFKVETCKRSSLYNVSANSTFVWSKLHWVLYAHTQQTQLLYLYFNDGNRHIWFKWTVELFKVVDIRNVLERDFSKYNCFFHNRTKMNLSKQTTNVPLDEVISTWTWNLLLFEPFNEVLVLRLVFNWFMLTWPWLTETVLAAWQMCVNRLPTSSKRSYLTRDQYIKHNRIIYTDQQKEKIDMWVQNVDRMNKTIKHELKTTRKKVPPDYRDHWNRETTIYSPLDVLFSILARRLSVTLRCLCC